MGYSYVGRKLCCDCCGTKGARKHKCPCGYCPATSLCVACNKAVKADGRWKKHHENCAAGHAVFQARIDKEKILLSCGAYVRCSALNAGDKVHVLFENKDGQTVGKYVSHETYDAIPLLEPVTPEDYAKIGEVTDAPECYRYCATTKEAVMA